MEKQGSRTRNVYAKEEGGKKELDKARDSKEDYRRKLGNGTREDRKKRK